MKLEAQRWHFGESRALQRHICSFLMTADKQRQHLDGNGGTDEALSREWRHRGSNLKTVETQRQRGSISMTEKAKMRHFNDSGVKKMLMTVESREAVF